MDGDKLQPHKDGDTEFYLCSKHFPQDVLEIFNNVPANLQSVLPEIILLQPDGQTVGHEPVAVGVKVSCSTVQVGCFSENFAIMMKSEVDDAKLGEGWHDEKFRVLKQGAHASCWVMASSENISDARFYHGIDSRRRFFSYQFVVDFVNPAKAIERYRTSNGKHSCYGFSTFKAMEFVMNNGIAKPCDWSFACKDFVPRSLSDAPVLHVLNDVRVSSDVNRALDYLKIQPIIGSMAVFSPDFSDIGGKIYRGPTSYHSTFTGWHAISIRKIYIENGEAIADLKNTHGPNKGVRGYVQASLDVLIANLNPTSKHFRAPNRLFRAFIYGEVRPEFAKEVEECYACGHKMDSTKPNLPENALSLLFDGIYHNSSCRVCQHEDKQEVTGNPIDRALFKWAIQLQKDMNSTYSRSNSKIIRGPCNKEGRSKPKDPSVKFKLIVRAKGIALDSVHGIHIHWKGKAEFILDKCTWHCSNGKPEHMSEAKKNKFREDIKEMEAKHLICTAIAFKRIEKSDLPDENEECQLPFEDLVFLALFGIKNPSALPKDALEKRAALDFEDEVDDPNLDSLVDFVDGHFCPSNSEEIWNEAAPQGSDLDFTVDLPKEVRSRRGDRYDICLYGRIGLHCHNLQKGTNFKFNHWEKYGTMMSAYIGFYITLEATDPATGSVFSFQTLLSDVGRSNALGVRISWMSLASRIKPICNEPLDDEWDEDMPSVHDFYKGAMPKWFSDEALERDSKKYYVVPESELHDNDWLQLLMEVAFFSKADRCLEAYLPLEIKKVVVETFEDYTIEPSEKLKADNAIFYISYKCCSDPVTRLAGSHRAIVRKTMDGKPGHMSLEVALTKEQEEE